MSIPYDFDRPITEKDVSESMDAIRALPPVTPAKNPYKVKRAFKMGWDGEKERALMGGRCECGQYISDEDKYCRECGRPLDWGDIFADMRGGEE